MKTTATLAFVAMLLTAGVLRANNATPVDRQARDVLDATGTHGGLVVHLGCGDGKLTAALRTNESFIVHGLDADAAMVEKARKHIAALGLAGPVSVAQWTDLEHLPYAENLVNLLVAEKLGKVSLDEVLRVLAPRGVAYIKGNDGRWSTTVKPWPQEMDEWGHWDHGADGNPVSQDTLVGPPRQLQWTDGPAWSKKHWGPRISAMVTAGGRFFCVQDETPTSLFNIDAKWILTARDAFNGVILWRRELPGWTNEGWGRVVQRKETPAAPAGLILGVWGDLTGGSGVRDAMEVMVATGNRLFVPLSLEAPVSAIDTTTGKVLRTYAGVAPVEKVVFAEGTLLVAGKNQLQAVDPDTGRVLWEAAGGNPCAAAGRVYRTGPRGQSVLCADLKTGKTLWETQFTQALRETGGQPLSAKASFNGPLQAGAGIVLATSHEGKKNNQTIALSADEGKPLWSSDGGDLPFARGGGPFLIDGLLWHLDPADGLLAALDPLSGHAKQQVAAPAIRYAGHHPRCYLAKATSRYIIGKERGTDFVDCSSGEVTWNNWVRGPCHRGVIPANGLLYIGQHSCRCYTEAALHGFHALAAKREGSTFSVKRSAEREEEQQPRRGPAYAAVSNSQSLAPNPGDWPTYRHDSARSGASPTAVPDALEQKWSVAIASKPSAPVVAEGKLYVAAINSHTLYALAADTGSVVWQYTTGGRIDSPPTIYQGLALFGCRDGWLYCLRADDGRLVWRRRAAPAERMVGAGGQLESAWPLPGSILIKDGVAYCVAGRSSFLDGGLYVYGFDPATGRLLHSQHLDGPWPGPEVGTSPETPNRGFTSDGALPDVLLADEESIYLRHLRFDRTLQQMEDMQPNFYKSPKLTGENRGGDHKYWDDHLESEPIGGKYHAVFLDPAWFNRSFFQNFPGLRLYATTGLLGEDSWHRRMYWSYGQIVGQSIVFRGTMGYAVQVFATSPREGGFNAGDGYVVYAGQTAQREEGKKLFALRPDESKWRARVALRPVAMALAGDRLLLAGPPDLKDPAEALSAVEGRKGGVLWDLATSTGQKRAEYPLDAPPVSDGMAAADGKLYLSTADGKVICLGSKQGH